MLDPWLPKSLIFLRQYSWQKFSSDLLAGITVGLVALPLAMAFAISSGVPPESGIYCAVITGFLISALGGSKVQIGGPTGAFVVVVSGIVAKHGIDGLFMCTMMAGVLLVLLGLTGMGSAVKFIPRPIIIGFTNGIALLIASTQIKDLLGLRIEKVPGEFVPRLETLAAHIGSLSPVAVIFAAATLALVIVMAKVTKRVPGTILALLAGAGVVAIWNLPVETIGSRFGGIPAGLPHFAIPRFRADLIHGLFGPAVTVAMLGAIESLMSAVVADRMTGDQHNPNVELIGQGVANVMSPLFGGLPATGAIARTATNVRSGAQTPVAGMIHAITLLLVLLFATPYARFVPLPVLAAILLVVSYNMGEWQEIRNVLKLSRADIAVWAVTFGLTVFADLTVAVEVGMILAALMFIRKVAMTTTVSEVTDEYVDEGRIHILQDKDIPDYVSVYRIHGPFLFGATDKLAEAFRDVNRLNRIVILRLRNMTALDGTGLMALQELADKLHASNRTLILCGAREQPDILMAGAEFERHVGEENICANIQEALERARTVYNVINGTQSVGGNHSFGMGGLSPVQS